MIYLIILVLLAGAGIASLWVQQRRERAHLATADAFSHSLKRLSEQQMPRQRRRPSAQARTRRMVRAEPVHRSTRLDPARREAAKRRLEARRRALAGR